MRRRPVRMTLYCSRVIRLVVRSALNTDANLSLIDLCVCGGGQGQGERGGGGQGGGRGGFERL